MLNFGGRSIFWSGLIPRFRDGSSSSSRRACGRTCRAACSNAAGETMNESRSMGATAQAIVAKLRQTPTRRGLLDSGNAARAAPALPDADGTPKDRFFTEPTGVFNTAELLVNQVGLTPGVKHGDGPGLHLLLNHFVEDVQNHGDHFELVARNTLSDRFAVFAPAPWCSRRARSRARSSCAGRACIRGFPTT